MATHHNKIGVESKEDPLLSLDSVSVRFGGLVAVSDVGLELRRGERLALLGPNGAGKTTLFNVIAGDLQPTSGRVVINGTDCTRLPSRRRPGLGVARTYQRTRLMWGLTVVDNLYLAQLGRSGRGHRSLFRRQQDREMFERAVDVAGAVALGDQTGTPVGSLSHGQQRQLEIGMALATEPELMMLDEPASGFSRGERERLVELLVALPRETTLLLIEHDMDVALTVAERVVVLARGRVVATGSTVEIRSDPVVQEVYLGHGERTR
jgi:branched-chain amino acid transport system ATP-binding protein